jgi:AhpD family alkylhydroperoxidase
VATLPSLFEEFRAAYPAVAQHYSALGEACRAAGPLDARTSELVKLGMSIAAGAEGGAHSHTRRALAAGATREELWHVALLAITTLGFPRAMTGLAWIRDVTEAPPER